MECEFPDPKEIELEKVYEVRGGAKYLRFSLKKWEKHGKKRIYVNYFYHTGYHPKSRTLGFFENGEWNLMDRYAHKELREYFFNHAGEIINAIQG